jgi:DNA (cytosine-5)-methyltransferase 1
LNYSFYTEKLGHPNPVFGWRSKFSDYLYKADPETPVRTVKAQGGQYTGPFSWDNRPFSVEEFKRLQTFPDDYEIVGNRQDVIVQLGNSVPPQSGRILALAVIDQVFNVELPFEIKYMPVNKELGFRKRKTNLTKIYAQKAKRAIDDLRVSGRLTKNIIKKAKGVKTEYLSNGFILSDRSATGIRFDFKYEFDATQWAINVANNNNGKKNQFEINIELTPGLSSILGTKFLKLGADVGSPYSIVALWKFLEKKVKELAHKDDLIQLFGYYQYRQDSLYRFVFLNKRMRRDPFWKVASQIISGIAVGSPLPLSELSDIYDVENNVLLTVLRQLKDIGYEIRNHNTNSQIKKDHYLIPYPFATLNERSLQRLTNL